MLNRKTGNVWLVFMAQKLCMLNLSLDTKTKTRTSTRVSHRTTLRARKPASFWREKRDAVVILLRGFAKIMSRQNKSRTR